MKRILALLVLLPLLVAAQCTPGPTPPRPVPVVVIPDAGDDASAGAAGMAGGHSVGGSAPLSPTESACQHLAALGCAEGQDPKCSAVLAHALRSGITAVPLICLSEASSPADARRCGFVTCDVP